MKEKIFKPGDRVKVLKNGFSYKKGDIGTVSGDPFFTTLMPSDTVAVTFEQERMLLGEPIHFKDTVFIRECNLALADSREAPRPNPGMSFDTVSVSSEDVCAEAEPESVKKSASVRHVVFDITDDGGEVKYLDGKNVLRKAKIRRAHDDEPNDFNAMMFLIGKLSPECGMTITDKSEEPAHEPSSTASHRGYISGTNESGKQQYINVGAIESVSAHGKDSVWISCSTISYILTNTSVESVMKQIDEAWE